MELISNARRLSLAFITLLVLTLCSGLAGPTRTAQAQQYYSPGWIRSVQVDPADSSILVTWNEASVAAYQTPNVSHFNAEGQLVRRYQLPPNSTGLGAVLESGQRRYYYLRYDGPEFRFGGLNYIDLNNGQQATLLNAAALPSCRPLDPARLLYNPVARHLYLRCTARFNGAATEETRTLAIDTVMGNLAGNFTYQPLAMQPGGTRLYALNYYTLPNSQQPTSQEIFYDLLTLNAATEEPDGPALSVKNPGLGINLLSFQVNAGNGLVYLTTRFCYAKCGGTVQEIYNLAGQLILKAPASLESFSVLNESNNQLYGRSSYAAGFGRLEYIAISGQNTLGEQLAGFDWEPLAVDHRRNLLYAVNTRYKEGDSQSKADSGLGLLVMNGNTYSISRFIQVRPPDPIYSDRARREEELPPGFQGRYFPETGHTLSGKFLDYWNSQGGLMRFGFPITEVFNEYNPEIGKTRQVQYFERNRFELHPELAGSAYEVQLGLLGRSFSAITGPRVKERFISGETLPVTGGLLFRETGHTLTGKFLEYWRANGGLAQHGLPLTEPTSEVNPIDGKSYTVQYFERSRLELHPEFAGSPYEVLMGLLGTQTLRSRGWSL